MGLIDTARDKIESEYVRRRGIDSGLDPELPASALFAFVARKATERIRGHLCGLPGVFVAPNVTVKNRAGLVVGSSVALSAGVEINALARNGVVLSDGVTIDRGAILKGSGGIRRLGEGIHLEQRVSIGAYAIVHGGGGVHIGRDSMIGPWVGLFSENHRMEDLGRPIIEQSEVPAPITIGHNVFISASATVLGPVTIGDGAIIAAGSVVTADVRPGVVVAGIPAREVKVRGQDTTQ